MNFDDDFPLFSALDMVIEEYTTGDDPYPMWLVVDSLRELADICEELDGDK